VHLLQLHAFRICSGFLFFLRFNLASQQCASPTFLQEMLYVFVWRWGTSIAMDYYSHLCRKNMTNLGCTPCLDNPLFVMIQGCASPPHRQCFHVLFVIADGGKDQQSSPHTASYSTSLPKSNGISGRIKTEIHFKISPLRVMPTVAKTVWHFLWHKFWHTSILGHLSGQINSNIYPLIYSNIYSDIHLDI